MKVVRQSTPSVNWGAWVPNQFVYDGASGLGVMAVSRTKPISANSAPGRMRPLQPVSPGLVQPALVTSPPNQGCR